MKLKSLVSQIVIVDYSSKLRLLVLEELLLAVKAAQSLGLEEEHPSVSSLILPLAAVELNCESSLDLTDMVTVLCLSL